MFEVLFAIVVASLHWVQANIFYAWTVATLSAAAHPLLTAILALNCWFFRISVGGHRLSDSWTVFWRDVGRVLWSPYRVCRYVYRTLASLPDRPWVRSRVEQVKAVGRSIAASSRLALARAWIGSHLEWVAMACLGAVVLVGAFRWLLARREARRRARGIPESAKVKNMKALDFLLNCLNIAAAFVGVAALGWDGIRKATFTKFVKDTWRSAKGSGAPRSDGKKKWQLEKEASDRMAWIQKKQQEVTGALAKFEGAVVDELPAHLRAEYEDLREQEEKLKRKAVKGVAGQEEDAFSSPVNAPFEAAGSMYETFKKYGVAFIVVGVFTAIAFGIMKLAFKYFDEDDEVAKPAAEEVEKPRLKRLTFESAEAPVTKVAEVAEARKYVNPSPDDLHLMLDQTREDMKKMVDKQATEMWERRFESSKTQNESLVTDLKAAAAEAVAEIRELGSRVCRSIDEQASQIRQGAYRMEFEAEVERDRKNHREMVDRVHAEAIETAEKLKQEILANRIALEELKRMSERSRDWESVPHPRKDRTDQVRHCSKCANTIEPSAPDTAKNCKLCREKKRAEKKEKGKETIAEAILVNSDRFTPKNSAGCVKMIGKAGNGDTEFKNGVVWNGSILTVNHGPVSNVMCKNSTNGEHLVNTGDAIKSSKLDFVVYPAPKGAWGPQIKVREPKVGDKVYTAYFANNDTADLTFGPSGVVTDAGNLKEGLMGKHTCSTDRGASGCGLYSVNDGALVGIHQGVKDGNNVFIPVNHSIAAYSAEGKAVPWPVRPGN